MLLRARSNKKFWTPSLIVPGKAGAAGLGLQTSLGGFWPLDTTSWLDATGNGTTLSAIGTAPTISTGGGPGGKNAAVFSGSNALTAANNTHIATGGHPLSISCWVAFTNICDLFLNKGTNGFQNEDWHFDHFFTGSSNVYEGVVSAASGSGASCPGTSAYDTSGAWRHLVMTWDGSTTVKLYVNGTLEGTQTFGAFTINNTTNPLNVMADFGQTPVNGGAAAKMALIALWQNRTLNSTDVTNLYNSGSGLTYAQML